MHPDRRIHWRRPLINQPVVSHLPHQTPKIQSWSDRGLRKSSGSEIMINVLNPATENWNDLALKIEIKPNLRSGSTSRIFPVELSGAAARRGYFPLNWAERQSPMLVDWLSLIFRFFCSRLFVKMMILQIPFSDGELKQIIGDSKQTFGS